MADVLHKIATNLNHGETEKVVELVQPSLDRGMTPAEILDGRLVAGMDEVGRDFKTGDQFGPDAEFCGTSFLGGYESTPEAAVFVKQGR